MRTEKVTFQNPEGLALSGRLEWPDAGEPVAWVVFVHCFTCNKSFKAAYFLSRALTGEGFGVLRFDLSGLGESGGDFADTNFSSNVADVVAASRFLTSRTALPQVLLGHSLGGAAVILAARELPGVAAVATLAAPFDPTRLSPELARARSVALARGEAEVEIAGTRLRLRRLFFEDLERVRLEPAIRALERPLFVFHAPQDEVVDVGEGERIFQAARHPKSFVCLEGSDHLLSREADAAFVAAVLGPWARCRLPPPGPNAEPPGRVVAHIGAAHYRTELVARGHRLVADEPADEGGTGAGPNPYDYLLAALGACTCMTLRMYADRKGWPLDSVEVRLDHSKIHAQDCTGCETKIGRIDRIARGVRLAGHLTSEQQGRLLEIADRCPVHRTLTAEILIETRSDN